MQTITVCTDASFVRFFEKTTAAWATYIRTPDQVVHSSGLLKEPCKGASHAELYAIANALYIVARHYDVSKYRIIVYSDNLYALQNHIDGTLKSKQKDRAQVYDLYIRPVLDWAGAYEARHVKGHVPESGWGANRARHYMQDWCDKEAQRLTHSIYLEWRSARKKALAFLHK